MNYDEQIKKSLVNYKVTGDKDHAFDVVTLKMRKASSESKHEKLLGWLCLVILPISPFVATIGWWLWLIWN